MIVIAANPHHDYHSWENGCEPQISALGCPRLRCNSSVARQASQIQGPVAGRMRNKDSGTNDAPHHLQSDKRRGRFGNLLEHAPVDRRLMIVLEHSGNVSTWPLQGDPLPRRGSWLSLSFLGRYGILRFPHGKSLRVYCRSAMLVKWIGAYADDRAAIGHNQLAIAI
jgi:hypothetical protein